jgi:glutathione S-transferase
MLKLIIGNKVYSSWSLRGWLAVRQSGLPFEEVVLPLYDAAWDERRQADDLAPSGGKVPILWDGDVPVWDSLAIIDHLDEATGGTRFWPADKAARAMARSMAAEMHSSYLPLRRAHCMNMRHNYPPVDPDAEVRENIARIMTLWNSARSRFGAGAPYLFGAFGAADIMFAPVVSRFITYGLPVEPFARDYMQAITDHPFMQEWTNAAMQEEWIIDRFELTS